MSESCPEILTLKQAADLLQVSERTLQRIVKNGEVPGTQVGGQWRFDREQLREMVRGEWRPPHEEPKGRQLVETESLHLGVEIPETLHDLQRAAVERLRRRHHQDDDEEERDD